MYACMYVCIVVTAAYGGVSDGYCKHFILFDYLYYSYYDNCCHHYPSPALTITTLCHIYKHFVHTHNKYTHMHKQANAHALTYQHTQTHTYTYKQIYT